MGSASSIHNNRQQVAPFPKLQVFLGGSCNPTTWRTDYAIPALTSNNISFYNPQVDVWDDYMIEKENNAKNNSTILLFVIDTQTRGIMSVCEAIHYITLGKKVVLSLEMYPDVGDPNEVKDINRGRSYLKSIAAKHNVAMFNNVKDSVDYVCNILK